VKAVEGGGKENHRGGDCTWRRKKGDVHKEQTLDAGKKGRQQITVRDLGLWGDYLLG